MDRTLHHRRLRQRARAPWQPVVRARLFGRIASERGGARNADGKARDNVIASGGGPEIMEAASCGAMEAGAPCIGFNIGLPHEQKPDAYSTPN